MPRRPHLSHRKRPGSVWIRGVAVLALLLTGCTTQAVQVSAPTPTGSAKSACDAFLSLAPRRVDEQTSRKVVSDGSAAAWGDPAIVATCGGSMPASFTRASACTEIDGVGWYAAEEDMSDQSRPVTITTIGWSPIVSVTIPAHYRPSGPASVMVDLAMAIKRSLRQVSTCQ